MIFCMIHGNVGVLIQTYRFVSILRVNGDANADTNLQSMVINNDIFTEFFNNFFSKQAYGKLIIMAIDSR